MYQVMFHHNQKLLHHYIFVLSLIFVVIGAYSIHYYAFSNDIAKKSNDLFNALMGIFSSLGAFIFSLDSDLRTPFVEADCYLEPAPGHSGLWQEGTMTIYYNRDRVRTVRIGQADGTVKEKTYNVLAYTKEKGFAVAYKMFSGGVQSAYTYSTPFSTTKYQDYETKIN